MLLKGFVIVYVHVSNLLHRFYTHWQPYPQRSSKSRMSGVKIRTGDILPSNITVVAALLYRHCHTPER